MKTLNSTGSQQNTHKVLTIITITNNIGINLKYSLF